MEALIVDNSRDKALLLEENFAAEPSPLYDEKYPVLGAFVQHQPPLIQGRPASPVGSEEAKHYDISAPVRVFSHRVVFF